VNNKNPKPEKLARISFNISMNPIDIFLFMIFLLAAWSGWRKGFLAGILELASWIASLLIGYYSYTYVAAFLQNNFSAVGVWAQPLAFSGIVLVCRLIISFIVREILIATSPGLQRNAVNHLMGVIPGLINGAIYACIMVAILYTVPVNETITSSAQKSQVASSLEKEVEWANEKFSPIFDNAIRESMITKTVEARPDETIILHFKVANAQARPDLESKMLQLVNEERKKAGLPPLKPDPELTLVARAHSQDMFARGYFSHYTPEKKDPFDRMKAAHVRFLAAGENLALGQSLDICHTGLMNSPGHRANILHPSFGRVGIGILDGGIYGLMISQEFRN
jgi:uncharacterized protein YkwD